MKKSKSATLALIILIVGVFMSALDNGIIASALSSINYSFHVGEVQGTWGITLYTLGMAISTPIVGKLADKYGRRRLFLIEITIFAIGSLFVALSPNFPAFLAARIFQSVGGGGIFIIASSHVLSTYPKSAQGGLLGALGAVNGIASVVGPNLGSLILKLTGHWNWLFVINLPIAVLVIIGGVIFLPETKGDTGKKLDLKGLVALSFGIFMIMLAITNLQSGQLLQSLMAPKVWSVALVGVIAFGIFFQFEKHISPALDPFLPYNLLKNRGFLLTIIMGLLSGALIAIFVFVPSFVEQRYGVSAATSGVWMSGIGLGSIIGAGVGGQFVSRLGAANTTILSGGLSAIGFGLVTFMSPNLVWFIISSTAAGIGFGMLMGAPLSVLMTKFANEKYTGVALGTLSVSRQVGLTIAPAIYATVVQLGFRSLNTSHSIESYYRSLLNSVGNGAALENFYHVAQAAYQNMFLFAVAFSTLIFIGGWLVKRLR